MLCSKIPPKISSMFLVKYLILYLLLFRIQRVYPDASAALSPRSTVLINGEQLLDEMDTSEANDDESPIFAGDPISNSNMMTEKETDFDPISHKKDGIQQCTPEDTSDECTCRTNCFPDPVFSSDPCQCISMEDPTTKNARPSTSPLDENELPSSNDLGNFAKKSQPDQQSYFTDPNNNIFFEGNIYTKSLSAQQNSPNPNPFTQPGSRIDSSDASINNFAASENKNEYSTNGDIKTQSTSFDSNTKPFSNFYSHTKEEPSADESICKYSCIPDYSSGTFFRTGENPCPCSSSNYKSNQNPLFGYNTFDQGLFAKNQLEKPAVDSTIFTSPYGYFGDSLLNSRSSFNGFPIQTFTSPQPDFLAPHPSSYFQQKNVNSGSTGYKTFNRESSCKKACFPYHIKQSSPCQCDFTNSRVEVPSSRNSLPNFNTGYSDIDPLYDPNSQIFNPVGSSNNFNGPVNEFSNPIVNVPVHLASSAKNRNRGHSNGQSNDASDVRSTSLSNQHNRYSNYMEDPNKNHDVSFSRSGGDQSTHRSNKMLLGCFKDKNKPGRDLKINIPIHNMKIDHCVERCRQKKKKFAAVQYGYLCFCGSRFGRYGREDDEKCSTPCAGDPNERCGGPWYNSVYSTDGLEYSEDQFNFNQKDPADELKSSKKKLPKKPKKVEKVEKEESDQPTDKSDNNEDSQNDNESIKSAIIRAKKIEEPNTTQNQDSKEDVDLNEQDGSGEDSKENKQNVEESEGKQDEQSEDRLVEPSQAVDDTAETVDDSAEAKIEDNKKDNDLVGRNKKPEEEPTEIGKISVNKMKKELKKKKDKKPEHEKSKYDVERLEKDEEQHEVPEEEEVSKIEKEDTGEISDSEVEENKIQSPGEAVKSKNSKTKHKPKIR